MFEFPKDPKISKDMNLFGNKLNLFMIFHFSQLMSKTDETSIRLDVINFCAAVSRDNCDSCADQLLTIIERGISDSFYKIVSESFRVLSLLVAKVSYFILL